MNCGNTDETATELLALKWRHAGQACITANRIYVQSGVYDKFAQILAEKTKALVVGHGTKKGTTMGPVTTPRSLDKAEAQVADAQKQGGKIVLGGKKLHGTKDYEGYFFEPTLITGAKGEMLIAQEETFAPIMALFEFDSEEEVTRLANDTSMGLASCECAQFSLYISPPALTTNRNLTNRFKISSPKTSTARGACSRTWKRG